MNDRRLPERQMNIVNVESALKERYGGRITFSDFRDVAELYDAVLQVCEDRGWDPPNKNKVLGWYNHSKYADTMIQQASDEHEEHPLAMFDSILDKLWGPDPRTSKHGTDDT